MKLIPRCVRIDEADWRKLEAEAARQTADSKQFVHAGGLARLAIAEWCEDLPDPSPVVALAAHSGKTLPDGEQTGS